MPADFNVRTTAQLARLALSEEEITRFESQLGQVLAYVDKLKEVDLSGVEPSAHPNPVLNVFRADESRPWLTAAETLANAPRQGGGLIIVPQVIE